MICNECNSYLGSIKEERLCHECFGIVCSNCYNEETHLCVCCDGILTFKDILEKSLVKEEDKKTSDMVSDIVKMVKELRDSHIYSINRFNEKWEEKEEVIS